MKSAAKASLTEVVDHQVIRVPVAHHIRVLHRDQWGPFNSRGLSLLCAALLLEIRTKHRCSHRNKWIWVLKNISIPWVCGIAVGGETEKLPGRPEHVDDSGPQKVKKILGVILLL